MQDTTLDSLSRGLDWGTVQSMSGNSDSAILTVDKTSVILNGFDTVGKYRVDFVDWM